MDVPTSGEVVYQDHNLTSANDAQLTEYRRTHRCERHLAQRVRTSSVFDPTRRVGRQGMSGKVVDPIVAALQNA